MKQVITGIHHITALASDPQQNLDFYAGVLGLRFIKKTVNFDAPEVYHFYYGNEAGEPGTILTFFPYEGIRKGKRGYGMVAALSFSVSSSAIVYWQKRLKQYNIRHEKAQERLNNELVISLEDHDGLSLELVFNDHDSRTGFTYGHIPREYALKGFYNAEIWVNNPEPTVRLLTEQMDHQLIAENGNRARFTASNKIGHYVDVLHTSDKSPGSGGGGTIHHIAFSTKDGQSQHEARKRLGQENMNPTQVIDRQYFRSVYFREPGGVLMEVATSGPGFATDEEKAHLGEQLKLPPQYESFREQIERNLKPVRLNLHQTVNAQE